MAKIITINDSSVVFPLRCTNCHSEATKTWSVIYGIGFDVVVASYYWDSIEVPVPVCSRCVWRRRLAVVAEVILGLVCVVGVILAAGLVDDQVAAVVGRPAFVAGIIVAVFAILYFFRNKTAVLLDGWLVGVRCKRWNRRDHLVTLWIRDDEAANDVAAAAEAQ